MAVWTDAAVSRNQPEVQRMRARVLAAGNGAGAESPEMAKLGLDQYTQSTTLCTVTTGVPKPLRVVTFEGDFPPDLLDRLGPMLPQSKWTTIGKQKVLQGNAWLAQTPGRLFWADSESAIEAGLTDRIIWPELDRSKALFVRMAPSCPLLDLPALAKALGLDVATWDFVTVSTDRGGTAADFAIAAKSPAAATRTLEVLQSIIKELREMPEPSRVENVDRVGVEATGSLAMLRYAGSLQDLLAFLGQLQPRHAAQHHH
jgi:hypothetical protein